MGRYAFEYLSGTWKKHQQEGYKFVPLCIMFDIKQDRGCIALLAVGGYVLDSEIMDTCVRVIKAVLVRLIMVIASNKGHNVMVTSRMLTYM